MRGIQLKKAVWIFEMTAQLTYQIRDILRRKCNSSHVLMFHDISTQKDSGNDRYAVTMKRLREKLNQPLCLKTVRSIGYCMEDNGI